MRLVALLLGLALTACSPAPAPVSREANDPSNPKAPEGNDPLAAVHTVPASSEANQPTAFTCPMHPDVVTDHAGHCPKCGMNLVPKK